MDEIVAIGAATLTAAFLVVVNWKALTSGTVFALLAVFVIAVWVVVPAMAGMAVPAFLAVLGLYLVLEKSQKFGLVLIVVAVATGIVFSLPTAQIQRGQQGDREETIEGTCLCPDGLGGWISTEFGEHPEWCQPPCRLTR